MKPAQATYPQFVIAMSFWTAVAAAIGLTGMSGIVATILLASSHFPPPTMKELLAAHADFAFVTIGGVVWLYMLTVQHERWERQYRQPQQPRATPRPLTPRHPVEETRRLTSQMALGRNVCFPVYEHHYAALYERLKRRSWKITKRNLKFEVDTVKVFPNIDDKYMDIVKEWNRLGFVDGYVTGEAREKWTLNEAGRAEFAKLGRVPLPSSD